MIIIGIGTGRCGTLTLSRLLNLQPDAHIMHEKQPHLPWDMEDTKLIKEHLADLHRREERFKFVGDVAFYWLPYLPRLFREFTDMKVVGLWREKEGFIKSSIKLLHSPIWTKDGEHQEHPNPVWEKSFPSYEAQSRTEVLGMFWEDYNAQMFALEKKGQVKTFPMEMLNEEESQDVLFDYLGMKDHRHRYGRHNANMRKDNRPDVS